MLLKNLQRLNQADVDGLVQLVEHDYRTEDPHDFLRSWSEDIWTGEVLTIGSRVRGLTPGMTVVFPEFNATPVGVDGFCLIKSEGVLGVLEG